MITKFTKEEEKDILRWAREREKILSENWYKMHNDATLEFLARVKSIIAKLGG